MSRQFDAIIVGAGQAGPALAAKFADLGQQVALVERRDVGGSCVNFGCTPTKAMIASARAAWIAGHAADLGVRVDGEVRVDMQAVAERTGRLVEESRQGLREWLESKEAVSLIDGHARFTGPHRLRVDGEDIEAGRIFINTGSRPVEPPIPGLDQVRYLTSTQMAGIDYLPEHLVVLGGGYIGVEFAQMFRRFGSRVTLVEQRARLLDHEDSDVSEAIQSILEADGVEVLLGTEATAFEATEGGFSVTLDRGDAGTDDRDGSDLLLALGRRPNSDDLDLDAAGVETDEQGHIRVDERLHTNVEGIWALGDVNGTGAFTHTAYNDHQIVADDLFGARKRSLDDRITAYAVYTDPPFARAGLSERQVRGSGRKAMLAKLPMSRVARARERGETQGFMKVLVDAESERIVGAAIVGIEADEVIHGILDLMYADVPYTVLRDSTGIHPTVSELLPSLLQQLEPVPPRTEEAEA